MRPLGFTLVATFLVLGGTTISAQQPPGAPGGPAVPAAVPAANLDLHLAGWERKLTDITNFRVEIALTRTDTVFKKEKKYDGVVLCMKPNFAILRLNFTGDPKDYEALICNGKSLYVYNGLERTMTETKLANTGNAKAGVDNIMVDFLSGLKAKDAKDRFDISLMNEDANYVYLDIKPKLEKDKVEFQQLRLALYGPRTPSPFPYLPCKVIKMNPNGDTETWEFKNHQLNIQGIDESTFKYVKVPGFTERQANMNAQPMRPGANNLPPGPTQIRP